MAPRTLHRSLFTLTPFLLLLFGCSSNIPPQPIEHTPFLANTQSWLMQSRTNGLTYQISVALPDDYITSEKTYNVLYGVDANMEFGTLVETARNLKWSIENLVIVGVGYNVGAGWDNVMPQRSLDLTPTVDNVWLEERNANNKEYNLPLYMGTGGADRFLQFMEQELIPRVEADYRVKDEGRAIFGHSFGGLFASFALFQEEPLFERFIIGSPSLWWGGTDESDGFIFLQEEAYALKNETLNAKVFLSVGSLEEPPADARFKMISNMKRFADILEKRNYEGLTLKTRIIADEGHMSVIPATISHGLRAVYSQE